MKNIVIVVDMQNGFARYEQTKKLTERIIDLLDRNIFDSVVATRFLNDDNSTYEKLFDWHRLKTVEEQMINPQILKHVDCIFDKYVYNCVTPTFIQKLCQLNDGVYPEKVFVVGADTDCCVMTIATSLFENNIRPVVLTHYCDSNGGPDSHKAGLLCMKRLIGQGQMVDIEIMTKDNIKGI
jgi:nicotinamidase-related amidase